MEIRAKIHETRNCGLHVIDKSEYVSEDVQDTLQYYIKNQYKYSETYTINILQKITSSESMIVDTTISDHLSEKNSVYINLKSDGYYVLQHIILPSAEWVARQINNSSVILANFTIYFTDGKLIYKYQDGKAIEVDSKIIAEINTNGTTISRKSYEQFSICNLFQCYLNLCKGIFDNTSFKCHDKDNLDDIRFKRDFIWMTINVIKYYVESGELLEAQRLLESINYCGGLCRSLDKSSNKSSGCGCNRQSKIESY